MSDTIIQVENLSKKYVLGHQQEGSSSYQSLRETIANGVGSLFKGRSKARAAQEEFWALKDVSFEIKQGDRVGIIGRNGAGKSTLLKVLSRITEPTNGSIRIKGRVASLLEVGTGFHPELTGRENIFLNGAILGMSKVEITRKFDEIVAFAEVEKFLDTPVKRYSSGMYVRLAFAVAAHLEPEVLIVDEVLAVGDAQFQKKCIGKMEDVSKAGKTVLFVSHNMSTVTTLCQKAIWLTRGSVEMIGEAEQITSKFLIHGSESSGEAILTPKDTTKRLWFKRLTLLNTEKIVTASFDVRQPIKAQFEFYVNQSTKSLEVTFRVCNSLGITIFSINRSSSTEVDTEVGTYIAEIEIPPLFLVPGTYSIDLTAHVPNVEILSSHESLASFEIEETGSSMAMYKNSAYGIVFANFPWKESKT